MELTKTEAHNLPQGTITYSVLGKPMGWKKSQSTFMAYYTTMDEAVAYCKAFIEEHPLKHIETMKIVESDGAHVRTHHFKKDGTIHCYRRPF